MEQIISLAAHRLTRRSDFQVCYDKGRRHYTANCIMFVCARADGPPQWRVGFAVSKKVGHAVLRNRVKRVLREFFRLYGQELPARTDLVVVAKRHFPADTFSLRSAQAELQPLIEKIIRVSSSNGVSSL